MNTVHPSPRCAQLADYVMCTAIFIPWLVVALRAMVKGALRCLPSAAPCPI
jgi:hypothetical protein